MSNNKNYLQQYKQKSKSERKEIWCLLEYEKEVVREMYTDRCNCVKELG
jgi:hypothetical protein